MKRSLGRPQPSAFLSGLWAALLLLSAALLLPSLPSQPALQLWYWHHSDLTTDAAVSSSKALIDRASKAGYTGVAFWDNSFGRLSDPDWPQANVQRMREVMHYAAGKDMRVMGSGAPFGWSNVALVHNGNLAEAQRVIGTKFVVDRSGKRLDVLNGLAPLDNSGFEEGRSAWFGTGDAAIGINGFAHNGKAAAVILDAPGNARFRQWVRLTPWRQYHLSLWFNSSRFHGPAAVEVVDWWHRRRGCFYADIHADGTHAWTRLDYTFDSRDTGWAYLYFGVWGKSSGVLRFDDISLVETAPVYVVRRDGAPLRLYDPDHTSVTYREGSDFNYVSDPVLSPPKAVFRDVYHPPVAVTLPPQTRLRPGQTVAMDFYAAFPMPQDEQVGMCLTEPAVFKWLADNARVLKQVMPSDGELLLSYDEMRQANSCASCRAKKMSAGDLLAWNVGKTVELYRSILPTADLYTWSDMFDPSHNAHDHYAYVEGDLAGSWKGLPASVGVVNWNRQHLRESLQWFAGINPAQPLARQQIIAGYYDNGKGWSAQDDLAQASGIPGVQGIMYVSWVDDYSRLESFAEAAKNGWSSYRRSLSSRTNPR